MGGFASCASEEDDVMARRPASGSAARPAAAAESASRDQHQQQQQARTRQPEQQEHTAPPPLQPQRIAIRERPPAAAASLLIPPSHRSLHLQPHSSPITDPDPYAIARLCVSATPQGKLAEHYKFFCPICMNHFQRIQQSECCGNYICVTCCLAHITQRLGLPHPLLRIPAHAIRGVCCPSCNSEHVHFHAVSAGAAPRSYVESPNTRDMLANVDQRARKAAGTTGAPLQLSATIEGGDDPVSPAAAGAGAGAPATGVVLASAVSRQTSFVTVLQQRLDFESVADGDEEEEVEEAQPRSLPLPLPPSPQRAVVAPLPAPLPMLPVAAATVPAAAAAEDGIGPGVSENPQLPDPRMRLPASEAAAAWQPHCSSAGRRDPAAAAAPSSRGALQDVSNRQQLRVSVPGTKSAVAAAAVPASASAAAVALSIVPSTAAAAPSAFSAPAATPITLPLAPFCATSLPLPLAPLSPAAPRAVAATAECDAAAADDLELPLLPADFEDDLLLDDLPLMGC